MAFQLIRSAPPQLVENLARELQSIERRYAMADWEPATLDGGQFCEIAARILYQTDSGQPANLKGVDDCLKYVEDAQQKHLYPDRKSSLHISRIVRAIYKVRSDRGAVHINPDYTANQLDARLVLESSKWVFAEILRIFWSGNQDELVKVFRSLAKTDVPFIRDFGDRLLVQKTNLTAADEILLLLYHCGDVGMSRADLAKNMPRPASTISDSLARLRKNRMILLTNSIYVITDLGSRKAGEILSSI